MIGNSPAALVQDQQAGKLLNSVLKEVRKISGTVVDAAIGKAVASLVVDPIPIPPGSVSDGSEWEALDDS